MLLFFKSLPRLVHSANKDMHRHFLMTFSSIVSIGIALLMALFIFVIYMNVGGFTSQIESEFMIQVSLNPTLEDEEISELSDSISSLASVKKVTYSSKEEELEELYKSRYDYRKFLRKFAFPREEIQLDEDSFDYIFYNYGMEHYGNLPLIEPLEYKEVNRLEELVIAIDTSGSCDGETVRRFLGETYSILSEKENFFHKMKVYLIQCDCCIQDVKVIHSEEEWKEYSKDITIQGRGGTDFRPVFRYVKEQQEKKEIRRLKALIYFTDGDGIYPGSKPDYETAFVFLHKTEKMELVPPWAIRLVAEQEGVRHNI